MAQNSAVQRRRRDLMVLHPAPQLRRGERTAQVLAVLAWRIGEQIRSERGGSEEPCL